MAQITDDQKAYLREYRRKNAERIREYNRSQRPRAKDGELRRTYGISLADFLEVLANQGGVCAICGSLETVTKTGRRFSLALDHAHGTGKQRGILCFRCNVYVSAIEEKGVELLPAVVAYLDKWK